MEKKLSIKEKDLIKLTEDIQMILKNDWFTKKENFQMVTFDEIKNQAELALSYLEKLI